VEPGLYVTFFTAGEPLADELPAVGPFDHLVVRPGALVADRRSVSQSGDFGGFRWIEAELELQRALGNEPGGVRRPDLRIAAPQGVYMRFASLESAAGIIGSTAPGTYTLVPRRRASRSIGDPGATYAATSAISSGVSALAIGDITALTRTSDVKSRICFER